MAAAKMRKMKTQKRPSYVDVICLLGTERAAPGGRRGGPW
eukprot:COSAG06_NODE_52975_length_302_cov_1.536946_1_plen_39_part_10